MNLLEQMILKDEITREEGNTRVNYTEKKVMKGRLMENIVMKGNINLLNI